MRFNKLMSVLCSGQSRLQDTDLVSANKKYSGYEPSGREFEKIAASDLSRPKGARRTVGSNISRRAIYIKGSCFYVGLFCF